MPVVLCCGQRLPDSLVHIEHIGSLALESKNFVVRAKHVCYRVRCGDICPLIAWNILHSQAVEGGTKGFRSACAAHLLYGTKAMDPRVGGSYIAYRSPP